MLILGGGMVGLSIAHKLLEHKITRNITIIDKELKIGNHSFERHSHMLGDER